MIAEAILLVFGFYLLYGIGAYTYAVVKSKEILGYYEPSITKDRVGVFPYKYWTMFWIHAIYKAIKGTDA